MAAMLYKKVRTGQAAWAGRPVVVSNRFIHSVSWCQRRGRARTSCQTARRRSPPRPRLLRSSVLALAALATNLDSREAMRSRRG